MSTTTTIFIVLLIQNVLRHKKKIIVEKKREHSHSEIYQELISLGHAEKQLDIKVVINKQMHTKTHKEEIYML